MGLMTTFSSPPVADLKRCHLGNKPKRKGVVSGLLEVVSIIHLTVHSNGL